MFGRLSDQLGRRSLFMWTLAIYLVGTGLTALTPRGSGWIIFLFATRFIAGTGIGGEYSAINSAIDEMMPARYRGRTDIWINGTYWLGAILGTFASFLLLNSLRPAEGWRVAFLCGPALAVVIIFVRRNLPESPRWLIAHGRVAEAEEQMRRIEEIAMRDGQRLEPVPESAAIVIKPEKRYGYLTLLRVAFRRYPQRAILGATLMITQSFLYNAIFFTYALVLTKFYGVSDNAVPLYGLAFAVGNLAGPLLLAPLFDSVGRKKMISGTYLLSGALLAVSAWLFAAGVLGAAGQTFIWIVIFFFASAARSASMSCSRPGARSPSSRSRIRTKRPAAIREPGDPWSGTVWRVPLRGDPQVAFDDGHAALEAALFGKALWLFVMAIIAGGIAVGFIFRGGLSELNRLAEPRHRAAVVSAFFVAAYIGLGLPAVLTGLISLQVGPVDASAYVSGLAAAIVAVAFVMVLRTFSTAPAPEPPCTPSDGWCGPEEPAGSGAGTRSAVGGPSRSSS